MKASHIALLGIGALFFMKRSNAAPATVSAPAPSFIPLPRTIPIPDTSFTPEEITMTRDAAMPIITPPSIIPDEKVYTIQPLPTSSPTPTTETWHPTMGLPTDRFLTRDERIYAGNYKELAGLYPKAIEQICNNLGGSYRQINEGTGIIEECVMPDGMRCEALNFAMGVCSAGAPATAAEKELYSQIEGTVNALPSVSVNPALSPEEKKIVIAQEYGAAIGTPPLTSKFCTHRTISGVRVSVCDTGVYVHG